MTLILGCRIDFRLGLLDVFMNWCANTESPERECEVWRVKKPRRTSRQIDVSHEEKFESYPI